MTRLSKIAVLAAATRLVEELKPLGGLRTEEAILLAFASLSGEPLDPWHPDDAAILARAERLALDGVDAGLALRTARAELPTWSDSS